MREVSWHDLDLIEERDICSSCEYVSQDCQCDSEAWDE